MLWRLCPLHDTVYALPTHSQNGVKQPVRRKQKTSRLCKHFSSFLQFCFTSLFEASFHYFQQFFFHVPHFSLVQLLKQFFSHSKFSAVFNCFKQFLYYIFLFFHFLSALFQQQHFNEFSSGNANFLVTVVSKATSFILNLQHTIHN